MKHDHITDEQIQAAIEEAGKKACLEHDLYSGLIQFKADDEQFTDDAPARLALARSLLVHLPDPPPPVSADGKTPGHTAYRAFYYRETDRWRMLLAGDRARWEDCASAVLAAFGQPSLEAAIARAEKAEAELARVTIERNHAINAEKLAHRNAKLPQLRPIAEAGPVPEGCVRVGVLIKTEGYVINPTMASPNYCVDIRLPSPAAKDCQPAEVEIPWIEWHGGECPLRDDEVEVWEIRFRDDGIDHAPNSPQRTRWRHHGTEGDIIAYRVLRWKKQEPNKITTEESMDDSTDKPYTPKVGDVVRLLSNGPKMTVMNEEENGEFWCCSWFKKDGTLVWENFPTATIMKVG